MMPQQPFVFNFPLSSSLVLSFANASANGLFVLDLQGNIEFANKKILDILSLNENDILGRNINSLIAPAYKEKESIAFDKVLQSDVAVYAGEKVETVLIGKEDIEITVSFTCNMLRHQAQSILFCVIEDLSHHLELQKQLYHQAITDSLTGLFNRRHFDVRLGEEFKRANRYRRAFSVVIIDIDGFKQANDLYGHQYGDEMLVKSTQVYQQVLREGDTVYRYGGDEFAMILPETSKEGAIELAERLKEIFAKQYSLSQKRINLSLSIGIASYPEDGMDDKGLIGAADRRMYHSKESGGNIVTSYDEIGGLEDDAETLLRSLRNLAHVMEKNRGISTGGLNHSQSIRSLVIEIGHKFGLTYDRISLLEQASILHDIGSLYISSAILKKESKLSKLEWDEIKKHTRVGEEIINMISPQHGEYMIELQKIIGQHHERMDGTGYPRGLSGEQILLEARILSVADSYYAMLSQRPYRKTFSKKEAQQELSIRAGEYYDPAVVNMLLELETES